jgi:hypothetical protein
VNVRKWFVGLLSVAIGAPLSTAAAQVGHLPQRSPYADLEFRQEATLFAGYYEAGTDVVGVAPKSGPMVGMRYELRLGGPALLTSKFAYVSSQRDVIDPRRPAATRVVEADASWPLYMADVGIALNLTGQRSFHRLVPFVNGGIGVATDFKGGGDVGAWRFGTPFALSVGGGIKWVPAGNLQTRIDVTSQLYQIKYPNSYYTPASDGTAALSLDKSRSDWTSNIGISLGITYSFFR